MFNPIYAADNIKDEFISYISTRFHISDKEYSKKFREELSKEGVISKGPYLDISDSYKSGMSLSELMDTGEATPLFRELEGDVADGDKEIQINRGLYLHQEQSLRKTNKGKNLIVTTGTGSGKTECFVIPIINQLLKEVENGTLDSGVRAILIYPMNALASDQMKRFRNLLKNYPAITFGIYNSSTEQYEQYGINQYRQIFKNADGSSMDPLQNELISREQMQKEPPHILVTNYAMLEYMMLRPKDDLVFSGAKLRFLVLDEAHVYKGTTGMETSLLLKRLKARISNAEEVIHILTSATLGDKDVNDDIVRFANTLCDAKFYPEDIIRSQSITPSYNEQVEDFPISIFGDLAQPEKPLNEIVKDYDITIPEGQSDEEFLYNMCINNQLYRDLRCVVSRPMTIPQITEILKMSHDITEQDIINLVNVAVQASKNKTALIKARYHMFAKALEGVYITLNEEKYVSLDRNIYHNNYKMFECAICDDCGRVAVAGKIKNDRLEFANNSFDKEIEYFLINTSQEVFEGSEESEEDIGEIGRNDYVICNQCGAIIHESMKHKISCDCGVGHLVKLRKAEKGNEKEKCPSCNTGTLKLFYLNYNVATAVLGTSLFEELPEIEKILKSKKLEDNQKKNIFASKKKYSEVEIIKKKRQFLAFSDSRGEAAFFASYMTASYSEFLRRRGIWHVVQDNKRSILNQPWEISTFVEELTAYFDANRTFAEPGGNASINLTPISRKQAWIAVLNEMVNARRSTSLVSMGILQFHYKGNSDEVMESVADEYDQNVKDIKALFDLLAMNIVYHGALEGECNLNDEDREYIFYTIKAKRIKKCKDTDKDKNKTYLAGWMAGLRKNGNLIKNGRLNRLVRVLEKDEQECNGLLEMYWDHVLCDEEKLSTSGNDEFYFSSDKFTIGTFHDAEPMYKCDVCGKITRYNCKNMCTTIKCNGTLQAITQEEFLKDNHYAKLYHSTLMKPLHVKEHTAQLGRKEQQKYQEMFVNKEINALSCSTTFEMGVDVGDLETVYLRNVPPSPANYVQRAGRAGRGKNAAAFSLTYAKLSSHDFTYYKNPENMITGKIGVPLFTVENEKVISRHIFAVALSDFFANNVDVYNANDADILLNGTGWERLQSYLLKKPEYLKEIIKKSIPETMHDIMGILDYSWADKLIGENGVLKIAVDDFRKTVEYYENELVKAKEKNLNQEVANIERKLQSYRRSKVDNRGRNELIEFLVRHNVLPKYGFPVDTVELYQHANNTKDNKLQMVRDLQLAISEYAPDAQIVADGKLYTSRYIRKLPETTGQKWETAYIAKCNNPTCLTWNHRIIEPDEDGEECVSCHEIIEKRRWKNAIEPRKGFIAEDKPRDVPMRNPDKAYRSEDFYIGDAQRQVINKYAFVINDGSKIQMETSTNDSLMVVCDDEFYVCPYCGFSISRKESLSDRNFNPNQTKIKKKHDTPWGKRCEGDLIKNKLCHVFKTDVVRLNFSAEQAQDLEIMLSVMYALLEATSSVLDIERNDIKGCLYKIEYDRKLVYSIVLYDAVAGGAGHVRRLVTADGKKFVQVVNKAVEITGECNCSPSCYSCLRNYYNQKIHDKLNRKYACDFLKNYQGEIERI